MHDRESILEIFPDAENILRREVEEPPYQKIAISVFDRWLGSDLDLLDCRDAAERRDRNSKLLAHWARVFDETTVFGLDAKGRVAQVKNRSGFLERCTYDANRTSDQFQFVVLPELEALYHEHWDDTNVVWFKSRGAVAPLLEWAEECGLYILEFET